MDNYQKLRDELWDRHLSVRQLALAAGMVPQSLYAAMSGRVPFWPGWRKRVAAALGMSEEDLFREEVTRDDENPNN